MQRKLPSDIYEYVTRAHILHRYPRWGDEIAAGVPTEDHKSFPSVSADTTLTKSHDDESREFERTLAASRRFDHLGDISNLSASVQKLLRDFASDSDELTKTDSSSMLQSLSVPFRGTTGSDEQVDGHPRQTRYDAVPLTNIPLGNEHESASVNADTGVSSQLNTTAVSIADSLPLKADVVQVCVCACMGAIWQR